MIYELIKLSNDYGASFTPLLSTRLEELLLDHERGYNVDKDELISLLVCEYVHTSEEIINELDELQADNVYQNEMRTIK